MIAPSNPKPPFNVTRAGHLVLNSRDLAKARDFYTEVVGFTVSNETPTTIHLRGVEERGHHCLTLKKTRGVPACERVGLRVWSDDDLDRAKAYFDARSQPARFANVPFQGRTLQVADAAGIPLEFCARMKTCAREPSRTHEQRGANALRFDHVQVLLPEVAPAAAFYSDLGFRVSDMSCIGERTVGALLHRKGNPHDVVLQEGDGPRLQHFGCIVQETQDLMRALDAARNLGFADAVEFGPGRHGHSLRAYLRDPDGHRVALLLPPPQMIDADDCAVRHDVEQGDRTVRGVLPPRTWFEDATVFEGVPVAPALYRGTPGSHLFGEGLGFREAAAAYAPHPVVRAARLPSPGSRLRRSPLSPASGRGEWHRA
jgi:catechol 2,3-dioxygenase